MNNKDNLYKNAIKVKDIKTAKSLMSRVITQLQKNDIPVNRAKAIIHSCKEFISSLSTYQINKEVEKLKIEVTNLIKSIEKNEY